MLKFLEFDVIKDMECTLQGGIWGGRNIASQNKGRIPGLDGKTLIFTVPSLTITFSDTVGEGLTPQEIVMQIVTADHSIVPFWRDQNLHMVRAAWEGAGITLSWSGTANPIFGFSSATETAGTYYNGPSGELPRVLETNNKSRLDGYYALVEIANPARPR
jgi:hypothetical protein